VKQLSVILVVLLTAACGSACGSASTSDPAADRQAIAAVSAQFEATENAGNVEQMLPLFADDMIINVSKRARVLWG
jgi:ABC-type phosphate/phosphonate transport system substrate-binding protein